MPIAFFTGLILLAVSCTLAIPVRAPKRLRALRQGGTPCRDRGCMECNYQAGGALYEPYAQRGQRPWI